MWWVILICNRLYWTSWQHKQRDKESHIINGAHSVFNKINVPCKERGQCPWYICLNWWLKSLNHKEKFNEFS